MMLVTEHGPEAGNGQPAGADPGEPGGLPRLPVPHLPAPHLPAPHLPAWRRRTAGENRWPVAVAIVAAIGLQFVTPQDFAVQPRWLLPLIEALILLGLIVVNPYRLNRESGALRTVSMALVAVASLATSWSVYRLVVVLVGGGGTKEPAVVLTSGGAIWLTNVIVFALWYWELDRGGPAARAAARRIHPDFLFPQMTVPDLVHPDWEPAFVDYLFLAFTNATAFSPTDTMPLSRWAKMAMMVQAGISIVVVALVIARAVNILGSSPTS
jgi:uncharacterized membrane protein